MVERFLIAWPDPPGEWVEVDTWPNVRAHSAAFLAFKRLDKISAADLQAEQERDHEGAPRGLPFLRLAPAARERFSEWRAELEHKLRAAEVEGLEGALSKYRHHVPALALALHVIDGGAGPVSLQATARALALAEYFESHTRRLYGSARRLVVRGARLIVTKARAGALPSPFTARDVYRNAWAGLADRQIVADALDMLAAHGWLTEATADTGGRPTAIYTLTEGAQRG
jgi:putative DNA primase/helicase